MRRPTLRLSATTVNIPCSPADSLLAGRVFWPTDAPPSDRGTPPACGGARYCNTPPHTRLGSVPAVAGAGPGQVAQHVVPQGQWNAEHFGQGLPPRVAVTIAVDGDRCAVHRLHVVGILDLTRSRDGGDLKDVLTVGHPPVGPVPVRIEEVVHAPIPGIGGERLRSSTTPQVLLVHDHGGGTERFTPVTVT